MSPDPSLLFLIKSYLDRIGRGKLWEAFANPEPGFFATLIYRLGHAFLQRRIPLLPGLMRWTGLVVLGTDICSSAVIGQGLLIAHPVGIVIGAGVKMGSNCNVFGGAVIGQRKAPGEFPVIGDNVSIYAGAKVLGKVNIGDGAMIGANAVVTTDLEAGAKIKA
jgi:serine O-acetyltransferase